MTLKDLSLGFSKRPYLQRSIKMATQGELLKLHQFLSARRSEIQDSQIRDTQISASGNQLNISKKESKCQT